MSVKSDSDKSRPRLCHLRKWSYFQGFGFNLHAEKTRNGQFIGKVDANSPAESAGLKEKDRIIEVNYVNISNENHQQVVKRIRSGLELDGKNYDNEVVLLVVDEEADNHYKKLNQVVKSNMDEVIRLETPPEKKNDDEIDNLDNHNDSPQVVHREKINEVDSNNNHQSATNSLNNTRPSSNASTPHSSEKFESNHNNNIIHSKNSPPNSPISTKSNESSTSSNHNNHQNSNSNNNVSSVAKSTTSSTSNLNNSNHNNNNNHSNSNNANINDELYKMSAAEYKNYLKNNKQKQDPRNAQVDMKQKFQLFQNM